MEGGREREGGGRMKGGERGGVDGWKEERGRELGGRMEGERERGRVDGWREGGRETETETETERSLDHLKTQRELNALMDSWSFCSLLIIPCLPRASLLRPAANSALFAGF